MKYSRKIALFTVFTLMIMNFTTINVQALGNIANGMSAEQYEINEEAVRVNGYTCLKELNAFYMTQILPDEDNLLELEFYDKGNKAVSKSESVKLQDEALRQAYDSFMG